MVGKGQVGVVGMASCNTDCVVGQCRAEAERCDGRRCGGRDQLCYWLGDKSVQARAGKG